MRSVLVAAVLLGLAAPARAEFCGFVGLDAQVVSSPDRVIPGDGGILVAAMRGHGHSDKDVADQPTWRFQSGGTSTEPRRTTLAPGLVVYHARQDGTVSLVERDGTVRASAFFTRRPRARLAAPVVSWVVRAPDRVDVLLGLAKNPPVDAIAIVVVGKDGKARSWDFLDPESTIQRVYKQRGCELAPPGTLPSNAGDEVTFFYVDADGRASAPSKPIKIAAKTPSEARISPDDLDR